MKHQKHIFMPVVIAILFFPWRAMAYTDPSDTTYALSYYDIFFDILTLSILLVALGMAIHLSQRFSGALRTTWHFCILSLLFFTVLQIMILLDVFHIIGLMDIFPLVRLFISIMFISAVISAKSLVQKVIRNNFSNNNK